MAIPGPDVLRIDFRSDGFPSASGLNRVGTLDTSWSNILWAALTIGRPSLYYVFKNGQSSFYEAIFRLSMVCMALQVNGPYARRLSRTPAFNGMDSTEKGLVNYFLGMIVCKLFSAQLLNAPWLLHLDLFRSPLGVRIASGRSRPDLIGRDTYTGAWHSFECKGRANAPSSNEKRKAKDQARRVTNVGATPCTYHIGAFTYFRGDVLEFYWQDPPSKENAHIPEPGDEWGAYYQPFVSLWRHLTDLGEQAGEATERDALNDYDVHLDIHPKLIPILLDERWAEAHLTARNLGRLFQSEGYKPDGLRIQAGRSWMSIREGKA